MEMDVRMESFLDYLNRRFRGKASNESKKVIKLYLACDTLHQENLIDGLSSRRAYENYLFICKIYNYDPESQIAFSRCLCRWFPYQTLVKHSWDDGKRKVIRFLVKTL